MSDPARYAPDLEHASREQIFYALTMFPYPSGIGLHCGHASVFVINDVVARYQRMQGKAVLNPFGFDAFGLPTENYAMKVGKAAFEVTEENKKMFMEQVQALNISFDYTRMVDTSKPDYYKWTQWIFQQLFKAGLVYRDELWVNRCPDCQTVLANDQVVDGKCERCKSEIIQKKMPQWFIKITAYADRLLEDLDLIDWPEETKIGQRNWIGRSEGADILFDVQGETISCFTTRPDTIYGVTALVLAPENTIIDHLLDAQHKQQVDSYRQQSLAKTAVQRQQDAKEKTGIESGVTATHPLTGEQIPVWFADYVLADYGSGAVMMVPAHDERDREFATKFDIAIIPVIEGELPEGQKVVREGTMVNSGAYDGLDHITAKKTITTHLEEIGKGKRAITYKLRDRSVSRQRYWGSPIPVYYDEEGQPQLIPEEQLPVLLPLDIENYKPKGKSPLEDHPTFPHYEKDGKTYQRECDTLDTFMCSSFYFLRYPDAHNDAELIGRQLAEKMFPIEFYSGGKEHTVGHLLYSRFIHKFLYDKGWVASPEPFGKLVHQGMVLGADGRKMGKRYNNGVDPLEMIDQYGADALRTYLMFMGPVEQDKVWNDNALQGVKKFLDRVERLLDVERRGTHSDEVESVLHQTIKGIGDDIVALKLNTVVSKFMILTNTIYDQQAVTDSQLEVLTLLLAPYATELAERLWKALEHDDDVHFAAWPSYDESKMIQGTINLPIQINGKMRGALDVEPGLDEAEALARAQQVQNVQTHLEGKQIVKVIYVQDKILNIVVK